MESPRKIDLFGGEVHGDNDESSLPPLKETATEIELLDYMVLVLSRSMSCSRAFKGGYMLNKLLKGSSRMTHDIDFSIAQRGDYDGVKDLLRRIAEKFKEMRYIDTYTIKEDIQERMSGGIDFYDADGSKILGVDVGLHNISYGVKHYDLSFTEVDAFTVERMLADKLIAITTRKRFRRTKDLYDFYAITNFFDVDVRKLSEFISLRGGAEWQNLPFNADVLVQYKHAWDKLELKSVTSGADLDKPLFDVVLGGIMHLHLVSKTMMLQRNGDV